MKKKFFALTLVAVMCISTIAGCANVGQSSTEEQKIIESGKEDFDEMVTEKEAEELMENTNELEEPTSSKTVDLEVVDATMDNPAKIGEWVETRTYADAKVPVYFRVTGLTRGDEAQKLVEEHNAKMEGEPIKQVEELMLDDVEYCVITYEVCFPYDYPDEEGLGRLATRVLNFTVCGSDYEIEEDIGTIEVKDISEEPDESLSGTRMFTDGKAAFVMKKGCTDYLLWTEYFYEYAGDDLASQNRYIRCE